jgi:hypothetical protein
MASDVTFLAIAYIAMIGIIGGWTWKMLARLNELSSRLASAEASLGLDELDDAAALGLDELDDAAALGLDELDDAAALGLDETDDLANTSDSSEEE